MVKVRGTFKTRATTGDNTYLYYSTFSFLRHPTYVAIYTTFAYILVFLYIFENKFRLSTLRKTLLYSIATILLVSVLY